MKLRITEGTMVLLKLLCFVGIPAFTPFGLLYTKAAENNTTPTWLWVLATAFASIIGVLNAGLAFSSGSFKEWSDRKNGSYKTVNKESDLDDQLAKSDALKKYVEKLAEKPQPPAPPATGGATP